ncbi:MAG: inositol monophosphatase, myo-inositol-1(or 4)-monophosphatase [Candidatus Gottesmanbacteria bacterium GW2011_GWA2_43_14]|uniref:Inositol-1-monophosphatase n=1 Tax=Candidatus Gottesmanbacteria bacterium GW2011_GWA2_43_14 TaxID=1618443 RepID=A0A0G1DK09_9BACT|nr:MAG: inositol monophosphatase, myo-inositol-1(or 4)-monophosphatase [Candidatus Gottesmanbacteria bacterium GW2011_GWA2_43_14]
MDNKEKLVKKARNYLLDLLPSAGQIARRYLHAEELPSKKKGEHDFVTAADLAVDDFLQKHLKKDFPEIPILTEETVDRDLSEYYDEEYLFIIDPLDGTSNFARGDDNFSISVALVERGEPLLGVIFSPISSRLFWTTYRDRKAFWNGRSISVSDIRVLDKAVVCTDWSHLLETRDRTTHFLRKVYGHVRQIKILGSAATDITLLARGGVDIYHHVRLFPWDVAAAGLIAQKAGAKVTDIKGNTWNVFSEGIIAANPNLFDKLFELIKD